MQKVIATALVVGSLAACKSQDKTAAKPKPATTPASATGSATAPASATGSATAPASATGSATAPASATGSVTAITAAVPATATGAPSALVLGSSIPADKVLTVAEIDQYVKQWPRRTVFTFMAYPAPFNGDDDEIRAGSSLSMAGAPGQKSTDATARCKFVDSEVGKKVNAKTALIVRGKLDYIGGAKNVMDFSDCEPATGDAPALSAISEAYSSWVGKEVTVEGKFGSVTTSTDSKDKTKIISVRLDIVTATGQFKPKVGCELDKVAPPADIAQKLSGATLKVKGTVTTNALNAGDARLAPCVVLEGWPT